jgi:hypothetical protein
VFNYARKSSAPPNSSGDPNHNPGGGGASGGGGIGFTSGGPASDIFGGGTVFTPGHPASDNFGGGGAYGGSTPVFTNSISNGGGAFGAASGAFGGGAFGASGFGNGGGGGGFGGGGFGGGAPDFSTVGTGVNAFVTGGNAFGGGAFGASGFGNGHSTTMNGATNSVRTDSNSGGMAPVDTTEAASDAVVFKNINLSLVKGSDSLAKLSVEESDELYNIIFYFILNFKSNTETANIMELNDMLNQFFIAQKHASSSLKTHIDIITATLTNLPDGTENIDTRVPILRKYVTMLLGNNVNNFEKMIGNNNSAYTKCRLGSYICYEYLYMRSVARTDIDEVLWRAKCSNNQKSKVNTERGRSETRAFSPARDSSTGRSAYPTVGRRLLRPSTMGQR